VIACNETDWSSPHARRPRAAVQGRRDRQARGPAALTVIKTDDDDMVIGFIAAQSDQLVLETEKGGKRFELAADPKQVKVARKATDQQARPAPGRARPVEDPAAGNAEATGSLMGPSTPRRDPGPRGAEPVRKHRHVHRGTGRAVITPAVEVSTTRSTRYQQARDPGRVTVHKDAGAPRRGQRRGIPST